MPYLTSSIKSQADNNPVFGRGDPGVLNYRLTQVVIEWLGKEPVYADYAAALGAMECVKMELYRRIISEHEDNTIRRNGDVYPSWLFPEQPLDPSEME